MIFESPRMILKVVRIVANSDINDIYICQDQATAAGTLYTVLLIKDHGTVHTLLKIFESSGRTMEEVCVECFSVDDNFMVVFPYVKERPLLRFYMGRTLTLAECEEICVNFIINVMTSTLPYPIIHQMLKQGQLNIAKDRSIYLGYQINLQGIDENIRERQCVEECAKIVLKLLEAKKGETSVMSYDLIDKKIFRHSYTAFTELYKDIRIAAAPHKKRNFMARIKALFTRNRDNIFKILLVLALILGLFVAVSFITNMLFGDIPWLRLFIGGFKHIGTENLAK